MLFVHKLIEISPIGFYENVTYKGCTGKEFYCQDIDSAYHCYTCDWDLCNPLVIRAFRGKSSARASNKFSFGSAAILIPILSTVVH